MNEEIVRHINQYDFSHIIHRDRIERYQRFNIKQLTTGVNQPVTNQLINQSDEHSNSGTEPTSSEENEDEESSNQSESERSHYEHIEKSESESGDQSERSEQSDNKGRRRSLQKEISNPESESQTGSPKPRNGKPILGKATKQRVMNWMQNLDQDRDDQKSTQTSSISSMQLASLKSDRLLSTVSSRKLKRNQAALQKAKPQLESILKQLRFQDQPTIHPTPIQDQHQAHRSHHHDEKVAKRRSHHHRSKDEPRRERSSQLSKIGQWILRNQREGTLPSAEKIRIKKKLKERSTNHHGQNHQLRRSRRGKPRSESDPEQLSRKRNH
jgi:hypothetical protein